MGNAGSITALGRRIRLLASRVPPLPPPLRSEAIRRAAAAAVLVGWATWPWIARGAIIFAAYIRRLPVRIVAYFRRLKDERYYGGYNRSLARRAARRAARRNLLLE